MLSLWGSMTYLYSHVNPSSRVTAGIRSPVLILTSEQAIGWNGMGKHHAPTVRVHGVGRWWWVPCFDGYKARLRKVWNDGWMCSAFLSKIGEGCEAMRGLTRDPGRFKHQGLSITGRNRPYRLLGSERRAHAMHSRGLAGTVRPSKFLLYVVKMASRAEFIPRLYCCVFH